VYLRSEKLIKNATVEIEYYPSKYVIENSGSVERSWLHTDEKKSETLILANGSYEETTGQNNKYVLTIFMFNITMNGKYSVYCGQSLLYTNAILLKLPGMCF
jgi:predicted S18 family serine protease